MKGDDWAKGYGGWTASTEDAFKTAMWNAAGSKKLDFTPSGGPAEVNVTALQARDWLTGLLADAAELAGNPITTQPGTVTQKLAIVTASWGGQQLTTYINGVYTTAGRSLGGMKGCGYEFPGHIPSGNKVHHYSSRDGGWMTYSKAAFNALQRSHGWYSLASHKEMFAEMYTHKYSAGAMAAAVNGYNPTTFFQSLENSRDAAVAPPAAAVGAPGGQRRRHQAQRMRPQLTPLRAARVRRR